MSKTNEYKLYQEDFIRMAEIIQDYIDTEPHKSNDKYYPAILKTLAIKMNENESISIGTYKKYINIEEKN